MSVYSVSTHAGQTTAKRLDTLVSHLGIADRQRCDGACAGNSYPQRLQRLRRYRMARRVDRSQMPCGAIASNGRCQPEAVGGSECFERENGQIDETVIIRLDPLQESVTRAQRTSLAPGGHVGAARFRTWASQFSVPVAWLHGMVLCMYEYVLYCIVRTTTWYHSAAQLLKALQAETDRQTGILFETPLRS